MKITVISLLVIFAVADTTATEIKIASFNVQTFGQKKVNDEDIVADLVKIVHRYHLILIQEIRDSKGSAMEKFLNHLNKYRSPEHLYDMILSPLIGRKTYTEKYGFFYRKDLLLTNGSYLYDDTAKDIFQREPFIVRFKVIASGFQFLLIPCHTQPVNAIEEINGLADVYKDAVKHFQLSSAIIMGDFNADCSYAPFQDLSQTKLWKDEEFEWILSNRTKNDVDTTTKITDCAYDRFVLAGHDLIAKYVVGSAKALHFGQEYDLSHEEVIKISDHYPIQMIINA